MIRLAQSYSPPRALLPPTHTPSASSTYWFSDTAHLSSNISSEVGTITTRLVPSFMAHS